MRKAFAAPHTDSIDWYASARNGLEYIYEAKEFFCNAYSYIGQNDLTSSIYKETYQLYSKWLEDYGALDKDHREELLFAVDFYCHGFAVQIQHWVQNGMKQTPQEMARLLFYSLPHVLLEYFYFSPDL